MPREPTSRVAPRKMEGKRSPPVNVSEDHTDPLPAISPAVCAKFITTKSTGYREGERIPRGWLYAQISLIPVSTSAPAQRRQTTHYREESCLVISSHLI